jgi:DNA polymerase-3 subunit delta
MVTTLTGVNSFTLDQAAQQLITAFVDRYSDMGLERLDGEELTMDRIQEALTTIPFLAERKLVVTRRGGGLKAWTEQAEAILSQLPDTTDVLLIEPKLDKRLSYYKYLKAHTSFHDYPELDAGSLIRWLCQQAEANQGSLAPSVARILVDRVGLNQQRLNQELTKLLLFNPTITRESVEELTEQAPQSTIFTLLEAAFNGDSARALKLYQEQRALKVEPLQLIAMLTWQLHIIALIKAAGSRSPDAIAKEAKLSPYVVKKSMAIARSLRVAELKALLADLQAIDQKSKRQAINLDDSLQNYLLTISQ